MSAKVTTKRDASVDLVENVIRTKYDDLSPKDREVAKRSILDTLGVITAGSPKPPFEQLVAYLREQGGKEESTIMVYGDKVPALSAVLANTGMARALDYDDCHEATSAHPSIGIVPAALAIAEQQGGKTGQELITAVVLGEDTMIRILSACKTMPTAQGRSSTEIGVTFGTAMVAGKLLELDMDKMLDTFGNAYCQMTGDFACYQAGALSYWVHQGISARAGVFAAILADIGVAGSRDVLESKWGYYQVFERGEYNPTVLTAELGKRFWGTDMSIKPYPCCKYTHAAVSATLELVKEHDIKPEDIEEITVYCTEYTLSGMFQPIVVDPKSIDTLRFRIPWCVGTAVVKRKVSIEDFTPEGAQEIKEAVLSIAHKVKGVCDPQFDKVKDAMPSAVEIRTKGRESYTKRVDYVKGHPRNPMNWEEVAAKFRDCVRSAAKPLPQRNTEQVIELVHNLEKVDDVTQIVRLLS